MTLEVRSIPEEDMKRLKEKLKEDQNRSFGKPFIESQCEVHGKTVFKRFRAKRVKGYSYWYSCQACVRENWRKATAKKRLRPDVREYVKDYRQKRNKMLRNMSIYFACLFMTLPKAAMTSEEYFASYQAEE